MPLRQYLCLLILIAKQEVSYVNCPQCVSAFHVRLLLKGGLSKTRGWRVCNITLRMFSNNRSLSIPNLDYAKSISSCEVPRLLRGTGGSGDEYAFKLIVSYLAFLVAYLLTKQAKNFDKSCLRSYHGVSLTL